MSSKCTIAYNDSFHFYHEVMDDDHVYLELRTTQFEAGYGRVMVPIPLHIWETIRHLGAADLRLADQRDEDLLRTVETKVDQRIADYGAREPNDPRGAALMRLAGSLVYGPADLPRNQQIENGMHYFGRRRQHQRELRNAIEALRKEARILPAGRVVPE